MGVACSSNAQQHADSAIVTATNRSVARGSCLRGLECRMCPRAEGVMP